MLYTNICTIFYLTYPHHEQMYVSNICLYAPTKKKRQTLVCLFILQTFFHILEEV